MVGNAPAAIAVAAALLAGCDRAPDTGQPDASDVASVDDTSTSMGDPDGGPDADPSGDAGDAGVTMGDPDVAMNGDTGVAPQGCPEEDTGNATHHSYGVGGSVPIITADETWRSGHVYFVKSTFEVRGCTLTIEPGARICMTAEGGSARSIIVAESDAHVPGRVFINGTADRPVVFDRLTTDDEYTGFTFNTGSEARFDNVVFRNGGHGGSGVLAFQANNSSAAVLRNVHLESFYGNGLYLGHPQGLSTDSSVFLDSQQPGVPGAVVEASIPALRTLTPGNLRVAATIPRETRAIGLLTSDVEANLTLASNLGADYLVESGGIVVRRGTPKGPIPALTVEAGTRVRFASGAELIVGNSGTGEEGSLVVNGTVANPVVFTSQDAAPGRGQWGGVVYYGGGPGAATLRNLQIENAGGLRSIFNCRAGAAVQGALILRPADTSASYAGPPIENLAVLRSGGDGLAFYCSATSCLTTDYGSAVTGSDNAGTLLRALGCP